MPEFTFSWFTLIVGVLCFAAGFALAIIIAAFGKASRMEEREERRRSGEYQLVGIKIATQGKPEDA